MSRLQSSTRLFLLVGVLATLLLAIGSLGLMGIRQSNDALKTVYEDRTVAIGLLGEMQHQLLLNRILIDASVLDPKPQLIAANLVEVGSTSAVVRKTWASYMATDLTKEEEKLAAKFAQDHAQFEKEGLLPAVAALRANDIASVQDLLRAKILPLDAQLQLELERLMQIQLSVAKQEYQVAVDRYTQVRLVSMGAMAAGVLFAILTTLALIRARRQELLILLERQTHTDLARQMDEKNELLQALERQKRQLERIARYDELTKLPNRALLGENLAQALLQTQRRGQYLAVVFIDLDGFKAVNDMHGHDAGDHLLITVAERMKAALRDGDILSRLGGDEFVAVMTDLADVDTSAPMLNRLLAAAAQAVHFGEVRLQVSASLGVAFYPQATRQPADIDAEQLLRQADQAMYQAKQSGKNRYCIFDAEQDRSVRAHHESMESIRRALVEQQLLLEYQPTVNLRTGEVMGVEALIRWIHPQRGLLPPAIFLPMIQDHPLAIEVGQWVIEGALQQIERWQQDGLHLPVSINIGESHLMRPDFVKRLGSALAAHPGIKSGSLVLEIKEASAADDVPKVSQVIGACREIGVACTLDDFGSGSSSLTCLKKLPMKYLKIEQNFVRDMLDNSDSLLILIAVLKLASSFDLQVIAEGVETTEHGLMLVQLGCELAQGYGIARPMPADELPAWIKNWKPDPAWRDVASIRS
jgi:diguanylate cyclase (GGDEF)-like protein